MPPPWRLTHQHLALLLAPPEVPAVREAECRSLARGLHSSTIQLSLSRFCHRQTDATQRTPHIVTTQIRPLHQVLLGKKYSGGKVRGLDTGEQSPNARTEKSVSVGISYTNCVLSTCFAPQTAVLVRRGRRAHLRLEGRSVYHGLSVLRLTRGEAKRAREKQSAAAPRLAMPKAFETQISWPFRPARRSRRVCEYASWWLEVYARGVRALTEGASGKEAEAARTRHRWKRRPTPSRRDGWLSDELLSSA